MTGRFHQHIPLVPKLFILICVVGVLTLVGLDLVQTRNLRSLFLTQLNQTLSEKAAIDRLVLDRYISSFRHVAGIIVSQQNFTTHVDQVATAAWQAAPAPAVQTHDQPPPWFPGRSLLRSFGHIRYALLLDGRGQAREVYRAWPVPPPAALLQPTTLLQQSSHDQVFMTSIDRQPFLITSQILTTAAGGSITLLLASPLDSEFIMAALGTFRLNDIVALVDDLSGTIIAASRPDLLALGAKIDSLKTGYLVTGKSFFDYGISDLQLQYATLLPIAEYEELSRAILAKDRRNRALTAAAFVVLFGVIILGIAKNIRQITRRITETSRSTLGFTDQAIPRGDEIHILSESFQRFSDEILASRQLLIEEKQRLEEARQQLERQNIEIEENGIMLQAALDQISSLIQQAAESKGFEVRFENPNLVQCHAVLNCRNRDCPCYGKAAMRCWQQTVTNCQTDKALHGEHGDCLACPVFQTATRDPIYQIGEQFNNMMHILEMKNKELATAYKDLKAAQSQMLQQEKMASIGVLAAGVAHEINNPIGFITSNLNSLGKYLARLTDYLAAVNAGLAQIKDVEAAGSIIAAGKKLKIDLILADLHELIDESLEGVNRVATIVRNLKSFSRLDEAEYKPVDINECLEDTLNIVWNELKYKAAVEKDFGELPLVPCYPQQLNQVFMNLLINAGQAIAEKGVIRLRSWAAGADVFVSVADTGAGIAPEHLNRLFEPFFTTKEVGKGTGLGLSIAYDIITKNHQGEITVDSKVGEGATFLVRLPLDKDR